MIKSSVTKLVVVFFLCLVAILGNHYLTQQPRAQSPQPTSPSPSPLKKIPPQPEPKLFIITENGKEGYIDATGKMAIAPQFLAARNFYEGLAAVKTKQGWGFINSSGKMVVRAQFERVDNSPVTIKVMRVGASP
jgi:hypothetical protein